MNSRKKLIAFTILIYGICLSIPSQNLAPWLNQNDAFPKISLPELESGRVIDPVPSNGLPTLMHIFASW